MDRKRRFDSWFHGWLPKEPLLLQYHKIKVVADFRRLQLFRLAYSLLLGALLFTPFGVYHSTAEPYIVGSLWGYHLPIGYVGLLLGMVVVLYPRLGTLRSLRFNSLTVIIGLFLLLTLIFSPSNYFINLFHGTSFSDSQIDVDFILGHSVVLGLSLLSMVVGLASFATKKRS